MKLGKWLKNMSKCCDMMGIYCRVYISEDASYGPIYEGMMDDIPWSLMDYKIGRHDTDEYSDAPIFFVDRFGEENEEKINRPGFVIVLREKEKNINNECL